MAQTLLDKRYDKCKNIVSSCLTSLISKKLAKTTLKTCREYMNEVLKAINTNSMKFI